MVKVLTTSPGFGKHGRVPERLAATGWDFVRAATEAEVMDQIGDADFLVVGLVGTTQGMLSAGTRLKGVLKHGVGVDNIDIPACTACGLPVTNTPGANADAVAELAVGLLFAMARSIPEGHVSVTSGGWDRRVGTEVGGKVLGIVGLGNIGRSLAIKARGLGMTVIATDPHADRDFAAAHSIVLTDLDGVLVASDYLSIHVFGGKDNAALIGMPQIVRMKPGARILNLARGEVVDLDAVNLALTTGHLGGAAIDAYASEPPDRSHPVFANPKAVFMPHSGADTLEAFENVGLMNIADMETILAGGRPARTLNPEVFA
ncbi:NAD(P)-dependent oxidoreductase [Falsirhodobacter xinxiangensis]|uniref:NAD(P)-dependent oxidoreductase n=1 Tax=Falsirhodobacter xinxiangensis TaxID=2530049 RepID=UPI0010AB0A68|nr:NAD(P)-dependent oxidoreductase [Rhodobacter xinxiangensis]